MFFKQITYPAFNYFVITSPVQQTLLQISCVPVQKVVEHSSARGPPRPSPARELPEALAPGPAPRACGWRVSLTSARTPSSGHPLRPGWRDSLALHWGSSPCRACWWSDPGSVGSSSSSAGRVCTRGWAECGRSCWWPPHPSAAPGGRPGRAARRGRWVRRADPGLRRTAPNPDRRHGRTRRTAETSVTDPAPPAARKPGGKRASKKRCEASLQTELGAQDEETHVCEKLPDGSHRWTGQITVRLQEDGVSVVLRLTHQGVHGFWKIWETFQSKVMMFKMCLEWHDESFTIS